MLDQAEGWFRRWFAKVWKVRGGGLYAVGWALTFAFLEIKTLIGEIFEAEGIVEFFTSQLIEFLLRFMGDSIGNMITAFIWPVEIVQWRPPLGAIALGAAFMLFPVYVKPHITAWLFPDGEPDEDKSEPGGTQRK
jgi:hypothetical protein